MADGLRVRIAKWLAGDQIQGEALDRRASSNAVAPTSLGGVTVQVDDSPGWMSLTGRGHDYEAGKIQELYQDALTAWRKNPIAWRIITITTDYVVGDKLRISSDNRSLQKFIHGFWNHPKNRIDLRLEAMSDELARAGDLFVVLFRNEQDGMSYLRFVTKDRIQKIETAPNDWETELVYFETQENAAGGQREWLSPAHPDAHQAPAVMLHYSVNRPIGALLGEGDLTTMIPWLQRYSRMLEDRVRLHWAMRAFLWLVTVPTNKVREKQEQYRQPPESGSIVVKDESEKWEAVTPSLRGADASHDMKAVRGMIDSGSGYPPHWRGESGDANLATATAMQGPTERHLLRRQQYFVFMLQDIVYHAYQRAVQLGQARGLANQDYHRLFTVNLPDISRSDNEALARSARDLSQALQSLAMQLPGRSRTFTRLLVKSVFRFAGEPQDDEVLDVILEEAEANPRPETGVKDQTEDGEPETGGEDAKN
jgi:hypothetical protein